MSEITVEKKDVLKHYLSSIVVYGITLFLLIFCPIFNQFIDNWLNYATVLGIYYILYVILAYPIFLKLKPISILKSRNVSIINYFKRQLNKNADIQTKLENITPTEEEKQAFVILFIKAFFGAYSLNLLCSQFLPSMGYNIDFISSLFSQNFQFGFFNGILQFIDDTYDMWLKFIATAIIIIFAFSYLTEAKIFGNKIEYADTTPLGIISCLMCFAPFTYITNRLLPLNMSDSVIVDSQVLRLTFYILAILINLGSLFAIMRLGTKSGNLTYRGIETKFPYNIVRHPDYSMQMMYIILTSIPVYMLNNIGFFTKLTGTLGIILWIYLYYLRAITEERNLINNEEYQKYTQKVKYRFIPKLF